MTDSQASKQPAQRPKVLRVLAWPLLRRCSLAGSASHSDSGAAICLQCWVLSSSGFPRASGWAASLPVSRRFPSLQCSSAVPAALSVKVMLFCIQFQSPNPFGRANVRSCHAGCSTTFARAAVAPLTAVAHLLALGVARVSCNRTHESHFRICRASRIRRLHAPR